RGLEVVATREPGGTRLGDRLRELLLDPAAPSASAAAEALLFAAARAELVAEVIRPALARGAWIVSDRFVDSSLAYQGAARGLGARGPRPAARARSGEPRPSHRPAHRPHASARGDRSRARRPGHPTGGRAKARRGDRGGRAPARRCRLAAPEDAGGAAAALA